MLPLTVADSKITPFVLPFVRPLTIAKQALTQREGYYLEVALSNGVSAKAEIAPLPGLSQETLKKARHDAEQLIAVLRGWEIPPEKTALIDKIREDQAVLNSCASVRFGFESALFLLAAQAQGRTLVQFLGAGQPDMPSAVLLQGSHEEVMAYAQQMKSQGRKVFKLKVGDRNVALDVKKVEALRQIIGPQGTIRLDANRAWSFEEALLFAQLAGNSQIEFIEEPVNDPARINEFFQAAHMPAALDESLGMMRCGVSAPGRCTPTLTAQEAVAAYIIKPMVLGGIVITLDWIEEAERLGKQAIISSAFESPVGLNILRALAALTGRSPGLDTQRWFKNG